MRNHIGDPYRRWLARSEVKGFEGEATETWWYFFSMVDVSHCDRHFDQLNVWHSDTTITGKCSTVV
ncbi:unnamed protein product [Camellia sinensis]